MTATAQRRGRGVLRIVLDRNFGPFLVGKVFSNCGTWVQNIAAAVLVFELTRSAFMVAAVSMLQFLGPMFLTLPAGALTDRFDRRKLLIVGRIISGGTVALLALLVHTRGDELAGPAPVFVAALFMGLGFALSSPSMQALLPSLVEEEELEHALAWGSAAPSVARTVGPAAGAGLLLLGGPALAFAAAAATHWLFIGVLLFIRPRRRQEVGGRPEILGGLRYLRGDRNASLLLVGVAVLALGADPAITLTPSLADDLGGGSQLVGVLASAFGLGAVVSIVGFRVLRRFTTLRVVGMAAFWILGAGLVITALSGSVTGASIGMGVAGTGFMVGMIALSTRIQRRVPDALRGRVMAMWALAFVGSRPIGAFLNGSIADLVSVRAALLVAAVITMAGSLLARVSYAERDASS